MSDEKLLCLRMGCSFLMPAGGEAMGEPVGGTDRGGGRLMAPDILRCTLCTEATHPVSTPQSMSDLATSASTCNRHNNCTTSFLCLN